MSTTKETINRLRELDRTASPAPWYIEEHESMIVTGDEETGEEVGAVFYHTLKSKKSKANAAILTEARNAVPDLLAEIDRLTAENTQLLDTVAEAWDEGYMDKETEAPEEMIERGLRKRAQNPYKKDN